MAKKRLHDNAPDEHVFYCVDGSVLRNLHELHFKLQDIAGEHYAHHANGERNDFHNWLADIYGDAKLGAKLAAAKSAKGAARVLLKALKEETHGKKVVKKVARKAKKKLK